MSKFDIIFGYVLLTAVCFLIGTIFAAIGLPFYISAFFGGLIGWNWSVIYSWFDKKMKDLAQWLMKILM